MPDPLHDRLITEVFRRHNGAAQSEFEFERDEMADILREWDERVRNISDVAYSYRGGRRALPAEIASTGNWVLACSPGYDRLGRHDQGRDRHS